MKNVAFKVLVIAYGVALTALLAVSDYRGWVLTAVNRGGVGRSYRSYGHK